MALAYLAEYPSQSFTLRNLGRGLIQFLEANPRWIKPVEKAALDMARLEWAHIEAFDNEAKPRLHVDSILGADPATIHLKLQPHLSLLHLGRPVDDLLIRLKHDQGLRSEASNAMQPPRASARRRLARHLRPMPIFLAVHRHNETVFYKRLRPAQFQLLSAIRFGASLSDACETLAGSSEDDLASVGKWFETWTALGWFCELE
jgi:hypothetical protein